MKIMVVDDSRGMRNIQVRMLKRLGYEDVVEAGSGNEALTRLDSERPDFLLVDLNMPRMDGTTLVRRIRETGARLPIIMCTVQADRASVVEALRAGVNNYLVKPFTAEALGDKIRQVLSRVRVATENGEGAGPASHLSEGEVPERRCNNSRVGEQGLVGGPAQP